MKKKLSRRSFFRKTAVLGSASLFSGTLFSSLAMEAHADSHYLLSVVGGPDYYQNTIKAITLIGGIDKFVKKGDSVGLLINSPWTRPGTYTNPDIALAVLKMCRDAGVSSVVCIKNAGNEYWDRSSLAGNHAAMLADLKQNSGYITKTINGKALKQADVVKELLECDKLINIPIAKHHNGTNFTGNLKNMMGACPHSTNRFFHSGGKVANDAEFLSQCIADLNTLRKPDLCVSDVTEYVINNGPAGPGELNKPQKIVAGSDPVAVDSKSAEIMGLQPEDISMINMARDNNVGHPISDKSKIVEI
jgi:uncharacterized protein (DUF362 family)